MAKEFNIPKTVLARHYERYRQGSTIHSRGRGTVFSDREQLELKQCIIDLADLGFAPTLGDIQEIVTNYVNTNEHEQGKSGFHYKGVRGCPGPDWLNNFMKKQNLSLKNATKLSKARYNATKNPFVIFDWFDLLEETIRKLGILDRPDLIWNSDESGLPHDPKKCKVVSLKGQKTMQIVTGSDRDNTTVLAAVSASGAVLPPLIIFQGKQVQTTWRPSTAANHQCYPWIYANEKGWMKSDIFSKWFCEWESRTRIITKAGNLEPRLMIYDGHLSHLNYDTIKHARINNVTISKLPPHTTDLLQPLDVSVLNL